MKKDVIKKSNSLTVAYYNLTLVEYRVLHMAFTSLADIAPNPQLTKNARFVIRASDYMELYGVDKNAAYEALKEASERLFNRYFTYDQLINKEYMLYERLKARWVTKIGYIEKEATVTLYLSEEILSMVGKLESQYTTYFLNQIADLTSMYAVRFYEMIIQWRQAKVVPTISLEELRDRLGIKPEEYPRMHDFKKRVLDLALEQINEHTDIKVSYVQEKTGRRVTGFNFKFKEKTKDKTIAKNRDPNTIDWINNQADNEVNALNPKQLARAVNSKKFISDYAHLVMPQNPANSSSSAWITHMATWLKKDPSKFTKRPIKEYLDDEQSDRFFKFSTFICSTSFAPTHSVIN